MATPLDLQEQEQLDELKAFWKQYGNPIIWVLIAALGGYAAWNGWGWWQREQAGNAGAMFDELDRAAKAGDVEKTARAFGDLKERYPRTAYTGQAGLIAAKLQAEKAQPDAAVASLTWVAESASDDAYRALARLRLAGVMLDQKKYEDAIKQLDAVGKATEFTALVADRRGDVLAAMGKKDEAKAAYQEAYKSLDEKLELRRFVDAKLTALGAPPPKADAASGAAK